MKTFKSNLKTINFIISHNDNCFCLDVGTIVDQLVRVMLTTVESVFEITLIYEYTEACYGKYSALYILALFLDKTLLSIFPLI